MEIKDLNNDEELKNSKEKTEKPNKFSPRNIISIICLVIAVGIIGYLVYEDANKKKAQENLEELAEETVVEEEVEPEIESIIPAKNIDWDKLKETNEDIYAWVYIPKESELKNENNDAIENTEDAETSENKKEIQVDYPVLQDPEDDLYYLDYNLDGSKGYPGCIYTEHTYNKIDFTDQNTVLYGHNMRDGSMFAGLHLFEDEEFYDNNRYIYVYSPDKNYAYEIFGALEIDDRHILDGWDFDQEGIMEVYRDFLKDISNYGNFNRVDVTDEDKFITLSTCTSAARGDDTRFIVVGRLVEVQENV